MDELKTPEFGPLSGVRVVLSGIEIAAPFAAQMMADWGAEVIWVENVKYEDTIRVNKNYSELDRRNMHNLALDIFSDEGREVFFKLIASADIMIESSKGPAWKRRGITDEVLWEQNPKLVIAHLTGYGVTGRDDYINRPSYDLIAQAFSGYLIQNGDRNQPIPAFPYTGDYVASMTTLSSCLAALHKVQQTGVGESIDVTMYEMLFRIGQYYMMDYFNGGTLYPRSDAGRDPVASGCGVYRCSDGYLCMELVGGPQVEGVLELVDMLHIIGTEGYPKGIPWLRTDLPHAQEFEAKLAAFFASKTIDEAVELLGGMKVTVSPVMEIANIESDPQFQEREDIIEWTGSDGRTVKGPAVFPKFTNNPGRVWRGMPKRGLDTRAVLGAVGFDGDQIRDLESRGIVMNAE